MTTQLGLQELSTGIAQALLEQHQQNGTMPALRVQTERLGLAPNGPLAPFYASAEHGARLIGPAEQVRPGRTICRYERERIEQRLFGTSIVYRTRIELIEERF